MASTLSPAQDEHWTGSVASRPQNALTLADLCDDVLLMICEFLKDLPSKKESSRKSLALTSRRFNDLISLELFKSLRVSTPLRLLENNRLRHYNANTLKVDISGSLWWWCSGIYVSPSDALDLFKFIHKLPNLQTLEVSMRSRSADLFEAAFQTAESNDVLLLPKIENLVVTNSAAFLVRHCPNLKTLVMKDGGESLAEVYLTLNTRLEPKIPRFEAGALPSASLTHLDAIANYTVAELGFLMDSFPHLEQLEMRSETYCYRSTVSTIAGTLGKGLKSLKVLHISKIGHLNMGFRSIWKRKIRECTSKEHRTRLWRESEVLRAKAENSVVRLAFTAIRSLQECSVGRNRVATRLDDDDESENENAPIKWMWWRGEEDINDCCTAAKWAKYRDEREAAVVRREIGM